MDKLLTQQEVSRLLGRSIKSLGRDREAAGIGSGWVTYGDAVLSHIRLGRKIMYRKKDVEAFLAAGRPAPAPLGLEMDYDDES
jgi:hypothetical protein